MTQTTVILLSVKCYPVGGVFGGGGVDVDGISGLVAIPRMFPASHVEVDGFGGSGINCF